MIGPAIQIPIGGAVSADLYLLRFGKDGLLQSPETAIMAVTAAMSATDVFLFSHGWNSVYADALDGYQTFAEGFVAQRRQLGLPTPAGYKPVLIGIIWPSTWFVLPGENGPSIAAGNSDSMQVEQMLAALTDDMAPAAAHALVELLDGSQFLSTAEAERGADLVRAALWTENDPDGASTPPNNAAVLSSWRALSGDDDPFVDEEEQVGTVGAPEAVGEPTGDVGTGAPAAAGSFQFDPRGILRMGSVWKMKGRAGQVGSWGVGPLLARLLEKTTARVHLVGHSFGARVLLSAVASLPPTRRVHSMLLLQPAVNRWCFADVVLQTGMTGGYNVVLDRVQQPILSTFSSHDQPLHEFFHLVLRGDSLGEINTAAIGDTERYGALGGYGPNGLDVRRELVTEPGQKYDLSGPARVLALDGSSTINGAPAISGHGDINNPSTWWALHCLAG